MHAADARCQRSLSGSGQSPPRPAPESLPPPSNPETVLSCFSPYVSVLLRLKFHSALELTPNKKGHDHLVPISPNAQIENPIRSFLLEPVPTSLRSVALRSGFAGSYRVLLCRTSRRQIRLWPASPIPTVEASFASRVLPELSNRRSTSPVRPRVLVADAYHRCVPVRTTHVRPLPPRSGPLLR